MIDRHIIICTEADRLRVIGLINANWSACAEDLKPLHIDISQKDETRRAKQNRYYFAGVLQQIAQKAWVNGKQYNADVWHEYYANKFAPKQEIELPSRELKTVRTSTTKMSVKEFSDYTSEVEADAAQELGVKFYTLEQF
ncbi:MAG: recombination protein NinB [Burkholderiales bacterium]